MDITIGCQFEYFNELGLPLERLLVITQRTKGFPVTALVNHWVGSYCIYILCGPTTPSAARE